MSQRSQNGSSRPTFEPLERRAMLASSISGIVFTEMDADGRRQAGEAGFASQRVYIDVNFDGKFQSSEPNQLTNSKGEYGFSGLSAGLYRVRVVVPANHRQTSPALAFYDIAANGADIHVANDFGLTTTAIVRGTVFNDTNGDGVKQITEQGVAGILVFIDKNRNGKFDSNEKSRLTDASGNWRFRGLPAGDYTIRVAPPKGVAVTSPFAFFRLKLKSGQSLSNRMTGVQG